MAGELEIPQEVKNLPTPATFAKALRDWLDNGIAAVRSERGEVTAAEDTFDLVRRLQKTREVFADYARAFSSVSAVAAQEIENELADAVGEQDGVPTAPLSVPDLDGTTIRLSLNAPNQHTIDSDPLYSALAMQLMSTTEIQTDVVNAAVAVLLAEDLAVPMAEFNSVMVRLLAMAMQELATLGKFEPQVTKVRALAKSLAMLGYDDLAATVSKSIRTKKQYQGIQIKREQPK